MDEGRAKDDLGAQGLSESNAETLVPCPQCEGLPYMESFESTPGICPLCGDAGIVDTSLVCLCGKPAFVRVNEIDVCWDEDCKTRAAVMKPSVKDDEDLLVNWPGLYGL